MTKKDITTKFRADMKALTIARKDALSTFKKVNDELRDFNIKYRTEQKPDNYKEVHEELVKKFKAALEVKSTYLKTVWKPARQKLIDQFKLDCGNSAEVQETSPDVPAEEPAPTSGDTLSVESSPVQA